MSQWLQIHKRINSVPSLLNQSKLLNKNHKPLILHPSLFQSQLAVNQPEDEYEKEADRLAEQIMHISEPTHQRKYAPCSEEKILQAREPARQISIQNQNIPPAVNEILQSSGEPLDPAIRAFMEPRFGHDFSKVKVHSNSAAEQSAREINASAYTVGRNIAFGKGQFSPGTNEGLRLIAHELTHVMQQSRAKGISVGKEKGKNNLSFTSTTQRIQRKNDVNPDPVLELKQIGDVWHLTLQGFTEAGAVAGYIWSGGPPKGVRIVPLVIVEKPVQIGLFELSGITLEALKTMNPPFESWFKVAGISWTPEDLKTMLEACDGGLGIWQKAKAANKGKDPEIISGSSSYTDSLTGKITLDSTTDKCKAVQSLIHELSNLSALSELDKIRMLASAGELSRNEFIKRIEEIEYRFGVKNVLTAYNACKNKWLCETNIMEYAAKAKDFEDYFKNLVSSSHKEDYGKQWDDKYRSAYEKKHPK
jgi:hypothetical protein